MRTKLVTYVLKGSEYFRDLGVDERMILNCIIKEQVLKESMLTYVQEGDLAVDVRTIDC